MTERKFGMKIFFMARAALIFTLCGVAYGRETLHIGALISQQPGEGFDYSGFLPALTLALETINGDSSLRYRFDVTINNSMVALSLHDQMDCVAIANLFVYSVKQHLACKVS